ncbi:MAG: hypothetical protein WAX67_03910 [Rugosibacter sp.]
MAAIILIAAVVFVLTQTYGIVGVSSQSNAQQLDSTAAFFLAESGLEQGQGKLRLAPDPTLQSACLTDVPGTSPTIGRGTFTLSATSAGCDVSNLNCTSCTITSTGKVGAASRTVVSVISLAAPSGGAMGCGGSGVTPVDCPITTPAAYLNKDIIQSINVTTVPVILFSNMAYLRHPAGGANKVNAATDCVLLGPTSPACITQWNDESNHSSGSNVVGSRGASVRIDTPGSYTITQHLTADSLFAAVGAKFGATGSPLTIAGSYWSDDSKSVGLTVSNNATASGTTNNGAACAADDGSATCPTATSPPSDPSGSAQTSRSWCYDADTLVLGFSGKSSTNDNGDLTAFQLGTSPPSSVPSGLSVTAFPKPVTGTNSELYSAMRYIYNPAYMSPSNSNTRSGALVTGYAKTTFTANLTKNASYLEATSVSDDPLALTASPTNPVPIKLTGQTGPTLITGTCKTSDLTTNCAIAGGIGFYATNQKPKPNENLSDVSGSAASTRLTVSAAQLPYLANGDTIFINGVTGATVTYASGTTPGGIGTYNLSTPLTISPLDSITSNGTKVTTSAPDATPPQIPAAGSIIAMRWTGSGVGQFSPGPITVASAPVTSSIGGNTTTTFDLSAPTVTPLSGGVQICGGICAFFNHASADAQTSFTIGITGTREWAAGMTCLKGVDTASIVALTGTSATVQATSWTEPVH